MAELLTYLKEGPPSGSIPNLINEAEPYDLLVAADVFVYIGDLQPVLEAARVKTCRG